MEPGTAGDPQMAATDRTTLRRWPRWILVQLGVASLLLGTMPGCVAGAGNTNRDAPADTAIAPAVTTTTLEYRLRGYALTMLPLQQEAQRRSSQVAASLSDPEVPPIRSSGVLRMEAIAFDDIRRVIQGVTPPPEMEAFHESLVEATRLSAHAYRVISDGLYQNDVAGIERGFEILGEAADLYHEAADLMTTLTSP